MNKLLDLATVLARLDISRSTLLRSVAAGWFPAPLRLGPRVRPWSEADVNLWFSRLERGILPTANLKGPDGLPKAPAPSPRL